MRLVLYILISIILFTSCRNSFTKRHYRPGVFREHVKEVTSSGLKKQDLNRHKIVSTSKNNSSLNLSLSSSDSLAKSVLDLAKIEANGKPTNRINLTNLDRNVKFKLVRRNNKNKVQLEDEKEEKVRKARNVVAWAILICAILVGIGFLIGGLTAYLDYALILIFISGGLGIALILALLILEIIRQSFINKKLKDEKIKGLSDKRLYRFKKNYDKLKSLNVVSIIFTIIGLLTFVVTETGLQTLLAWSFFIGLVIAFIILIRVIIMIYEYRKNKELLGEAEIKNYKKVRNFSLVIGSLFLAAAIFISLLFILV